MSELVKYNIFILNTMILSWLLKFSSRLLSQFIICVKVDFNPFQWYLFSLKSVFNYLPAHSVLIPACVTELLITSF